MARYKTYANGSFVFPSDLNKIQDDYDAKILARGAVSGLDADRPVASTLFPGRRWYATDTGGVYLDVGTRWVTLVPPRLTALPASPLDGDEVDLLVDSAGAYGGPLVWRCRYRAAGGTHKWEVTGGSPMQVVQTASATQFTGGISTYEAIGNMPTLTPPRSGIYEVFFDGDIQPTLFNGTPSAVVTFGTGTNPNPPSVRIDLPVVYNPVSRGPRHISLVAGTAYTLLAATNGTDGMIFGGQYPFTLSIRPVRLG